MNDLVFIFFTIFVVTGMIYVLYKIMLGSDKDSKDADLQISNRDLLEQISILQKQKKYAIAESLAKNFLEKKPNAFDVRVGLAKVLYDQKKYFEAIDQTKIILKHQPNNYDMKIFLANCFLEIDKPLRAIDTLEDVIDHDLTNAVAIKQLANIYYDTNQKKSALKMFLKLEELIESNHERANVKAVIAELNVTFKEYDDAICQYKEILDLYPDDIDARKNLIEVYKLTADYVTVIEAAKEMVDSSDSATVLWALKMLRDAYRLMQNYEEALKYANLVKEHPLSDRNKSSEVIAEILLDQGDVQASIDLLKTLAQNDEENITLKKSLAKSYEMNRDFEAATEMYKKIIEIANPKDIPEIHKELSGIYSNWAMYAFAKSDSENCFKYFTIALKYYDQNPEVYYRLGTVNKLIKNFNEAILQFKKAIDFDPENAEYLFSISECYEEIDSIYDQKKYLSECLKYNPSNAKAHYKIGLIYEIQGDSENAVANIRSAIELDKNYMEAKYKLALMLEHTGKIEEAIALYEEILRLNPNNTEVANNLRMLRP